MHPATPALSHRLAHLVLGVTIGAFVLIILVCCGLHAYTHYVAHQAITLLDETARIPIGANEDSVLPLVARYGGIRLVPPSPTPTDNCVDKEECEYQNARIPDYIYEMEVSPFHVFSPPDDQAGRVHHVLSVLMFQTRSSWRDPFSLRDWTVEANISMRAGRVEAVSGAVYVEGRTRWLGNTWRLSAEMPRLDLGSKAYAVNGTFLTFPGHGGAGTNQYLTPAATPEQVRAAQSFNARCITNFVPCRCPSDLTPLAFRYLNRHPEAGDTVVADDCPSASSSSFSALGR